MDGRTSARIANLGFVAALLVVFIHLADAPTDLGTASGLTYAVIRRVFATVAVPYFFLVSGFFLAKRSSEAGWWTSAVGKRLRTLGVPYLVWCAVPFLLFSVLWPVGSPDGICARAQMKASSIAAAFGLNFFTNPEANRPLWYLRDLFLLVLLSPLIGWILRASRGLALAAFLVLYLAVNPGTLDFPGFWMGQRWRIFWTFGFSLEGLFYFSVGWFLAFHPMDLTRRAGLSLGAVGLLLGAVAVGLAAHGSPWSGYASELSVPFVMAGLWVLTPSVPWPRGLVGNAFAVYVMHPIFLRLLLEPRRLLPDTPAMFAVEWLLAVLASVFVAIVLRKASPKAADLAFGGR